MIKLNNISLLLIAIFYLNIANSFAQQDGCSFYHEFTADTFPSNVKNKYFDKYCIIKLGDTYHIYAIKEVTIIYEYLVDLMNDFERLDDFMPGYKEIELTGQNSDQIITGIDFKPKFSPVSSLFTNEVEVYSDSSLYIQCWKQLAQEDPRTTHHNKNAPIQNEGFWKFKALENEMVGMEYYLKIQPHTKIPAWLYRLVAKNSYKNVFKAVIQTAMEIGEDDNSIDNHLQIDM